MTTVILKTRWLFMTILVGAVLCSVTAGASTVLYSTLGPANQYDGSGGWTVGGYSYGNQVIAEPFVLDTWATVGDAVLALGNVEGGNNPVNVYIESDNSGQPGSILTTLSQVGEIPSWFSGGGLVTYTCGLACTLGPGLYWLVAWEPDASTMQGWDLAYKDPIGFGAWNSIGSPTGPWSTGESTQTAFRIDAASPIPEPNSLVLLGSGLLGVAALVLRRLKS